MSDSGDYAFTINFAPFIVMIVVGAILVFVVERIGNARAGSGSGSGRRSSSSGDMNVSKYLERKASDIRARRRKREDAQRALIHRIKLFGIATGMALTLALVSFVNVVGLMLSDSSSNDGDIFFAIIPLIIGVALTTVFTLRFFEDKRTYELYYGSIFGKKS